MAESVVCPVFVVLWESLSSSAWSLSSSECVQRSAAEWSEESELVSCGSFAEAARCVVRAEVWESLAEELSVSDAWERVVCALDDWRECLSAECPVSWSSSPVCAVACAPVVGCAHCVAEV